MIYSYFSEKEIGTERLSNWPKFHRTLALVVETNLKLVVSSLSSCLWVPTQNIYPCSQTWFPMSLVATVFPEIKYFSTSDTCYFSHEDSSNQIIVYKRQWHQNMDIYDETTPTQMQAFPIFLVSLNFPVIFSSFNCSLIPEFFVSRAAGMGTRIKPSFVMLCSIHRQSDGKGFKRIF